MVTLYKNAIEKSSHSKRDSSSSDEPMDTSEEYEKMFEGESANTHSSNQMVAQYIAEHTPTKETGDRMEEQPHCSRYNMDRYAATPERHCEPTVRMLTPPPLTKTSENMIQRSEAKKAHIYAAPGKNLIHSVLLHEDYLIAGNHVNEITRKKIGNGEYVDFSKLMPRDRIALEEDQRMEMVNRGGMSFWVPLLD